MKTSDKKIEEKDRQLLNLELILGFVSTVAFLILTFLASYIKMPLWLTILLIAIGIIILIIAIFSCIKIEQTAGYYECGKCHHKYVPKYWSVFLAPHIQRTRYMKCPKCRNWSWHQKRVSK